MKSLIIIFFFFLASASAAITDGERLLTSNIIKYSLQISYDREKNSIVSRIQNQSPVTIFLREDSTPASLFIRGINYSAFSDSEDLRRISLVRPVGSNEREIPIASGDFLAEELKLNEFVVGYCDALKTSPILFFWIYSAKSKDYVLLPSDGVFRVKKEDVDCQDEIKN